MGNVVLLLVVALTVGAVVFGVMTLITGGDPGLRAVEPDDRARPLPGDRPLVEEDVTKATFDVAWRGYRMAQVDQTLRRLAYDTGYKSELIQVLEAEIVALREGRLEDADTLAKTRAAALDRSRDAVAEMPAEPAVGSVDELPPADPDEVTPEAEFEVDTDVEPEPARDPEGVPSATGGGSR